MAFFCTHFGHSDAYDTSCDLAKYAACNDFDDGSNHILFYLHVYLISTVSFRHRYLLHLPSAGY